MASPKVSIIVPNYNGADTIELCVESILAQTFADWELIIADNGSTDGSLELLVKIASKYPRIKIISVLQKGVSHARNAALDIAVGEYICFVDSDDTIEPDYIAELISCQNDLTICGYQLDFLDGSGNVERIDQRTLPPVDWQVDNSKECLISAFEMGFIHFCWNKMYLRKIIEKHALRFRPFPVNEDYIFTMEYILHAHSIAIIDKPLYHWRRQSGKITGVNSIPDNLLDIYHHSHLLTRQFFQNDSVADRIAYFSYELLVYKFYDAYLKGRVERGKLKKLLRQFHNNTLCKSAYKAYIPMTLGDRVLHWLISHEWFNTHFIITQKILQ